MKILCFFRFSHLVLDGVEALLRVLLVFSSDLYVRTAHKADFIRVAVILGDAVMLCTMTCVSPSLRPSLPFFPPPSTLPATGFVKIHTDKHCSSCCLTLLWLFLLLSTRRLPLAEYTTCFSPLLLLFSQ
jgi:hypothetical protein